MTAELPDSSLATELESLRAEYARQLPGKVRSLEDTWLKLKGRWQPELATSLVEGVHRLAGSGATMGYPTVSEVARVLEEKFDELAERAQAPTRRDQKAIDELMLALVNASRERQRAFALRGGVPTPVPTAETKRALGGARTVGLLLSDAQAAEDLAAQLGHFGYATHIVPEIGELRRVSLSAPPPALVVDASRLEREPAAKEVLRDLNQQFGNTLPVAVISEAADFVARLNAVRAGAKAFLTLPLDLGELVDRLETIISPPGQEPYRILIVDDDEVFAKTVAVALERAGMVAAVITESSKVVNLLPEFRPDLILMDLYMPMCSGQELAAVIRQYPGYLGLSIVFLSVEASPDRRNLAMRAGADDFLSKPIRMDHLISSVTARAERWRQVRTFLVRDAMTGLLNHKAILERLEVECAGARRRSSALAFAMLDLDRFKDVNDVHGHATGDRVIVNLARFLKQRLRRTDTVGRYGGEEIAVVMPDTDAAAAAKVLDECRASFAHVRHRSDSGAEFRVTFSGGVADVATFGDPQRLSRMADKALYEAKQGGRDNIVTATEEGGPAILVIDDEAEIRKLLRAVFERQGYRVYLAEDGLDGLKLATEVKPKLIVSDLLLPRLHGFELCKKIKSHPVLKQIPLILMTSVYKRTRYRLELKDLGANAFLEKPLDLEALLAKVEQWLAPKEGGQPELLGDQRG